MRYTIYQGNVYCDEKCFEYVLSEVDKVRYDVLCVMCYVW